MKIGLVLPMTEARGVMEPYTTLRAYAWQAEASGLDSLWVSDHVLLRTSEDAALRTWEAWTVLAALAEATTRVELGPLVLCAPFRNPALLARMVATLVEVSGSRLVLGLGAGWHRPEFDLLQLPFDRLVERFERYVRDLRDLLDGPAAPRLLIGGGGPRLLQVAARHGDYTNTSWLDRPEQLAEPRRAIEQSCERVGRDPASLGMTVGANVRVPESAGNGWLEDTADLLGRYEVAGVVHLMCSLHPLTPDTLARFARAVVAHRRGTAPS